MQVFNVEMVYFAFIKIMIKPIILKTTPSMIRAYKLWVNCDPLIPNELNTAESNSHLVVYKLIRINWKTSLRLLEKWMIWTKYGII